MPGQEKMVMEFYQKNPSALASLRGNVYEEKIINLIKSKAKPNKKEISKTEAEKILKDSHEKDHNNHHNHDQPEEKKTKSQTKPIKIKKTKSKTAKPLKTKKVSKK
jgi:trigger factor